MVDPNALPVSNPDLTAAVSQISAFLSHLTVGGTSAHLLQWAKARPGFAKVWGVMSDRSKSVIAAVLALLGSLGITSAFHYDPAVGILTATWTGITAASVGAHVWSFTQSYVMQTAWYKTIIKATVISGALPIAGQPVVPVPVVPVAPAPAQKVGG
jgi:hypothetical protein